MNKWYQKLDFELAIARIRENERRGKDFFLDPLRFEDLSFKEVRSDLKAISLEKIERKRNVNPLFQIDVPKSNYILRPGARPHLVDWVIYEAVTLFIASKIYNKVPAVSYSFLSAKQLFNKKSNKKQAIEYWIDFENTALFLSRKYDLLLVTDITSFYENISLEVLKERLLSLDDSSDYIEAVNYLVEYNLKPWTNNSRVKNFGLPQGPNASSILADIYLYSIDRDMKSLKGLSFIRYMDDMRVYSKTELQLKIGMKKLVKSLRELKLNLNAKKTSIHKTQDKESLKKVFDEQKQMLDLIDKAIKSRESSKIDWVFDALKDLYELSKTEQNVFSERHFKFFIGRIIDLMKLGKISKDYIRGLVKDLLKIFEEKHHLADKISWFLVSTAQYDYECKNIIKKSLIKFLKNKDKNIYEWQEMWAMDVLRQLDNFEKREINFLRKRLDSHSVCFSQIVLILGKNNNVDDNDCLFACIDNFVSDDDRFRYLIIALQISYKKGLLCKIDEKIPPYLKTYLSKLKNSKFGFCSFLQRQDLKVGEEKINFDYFEY